MSKPRTIEVAVYVKATLVKAVTVFCDPEDVEVAATDKAREQLDVGDLDGWDLTADWDIAKFDDA